MRKEKTLKRIIVLAAAAFAGLSTSAVAEVHGFSAVAITPDQETNSVTSSGSGTLHGVYDDATNQLIYFVSYGLDGANTQAGAHFHGPAGPGTDAGVQVPIAANGPTTGTITGSATLTETQEGELLAGQWYVNIHSNAWPSGEIRGQLIPSASTHSFSSLAMDGSQGPSVVSPAGTGLVSAIYDSASNALTYGVVFTGMTSNVTVAHFHGPATTAQTAGPQVTITGLPSATDGTTAGMAVLTEGQETDLLNELWYINVHTVNNGGGEIRTQMIPDGTSVEEWMVF